MEDLSNSVEADGHEKLIINIKKRGEGSKEKLTTTFLASCVASLATFGFGYNMGFPSPVMSSLIDNGFLSKEEFSWFNVCKKLIFFYVLTL